MAGKEIINCKLFKCSAVVNENQRRVIDFALETDIPVGSLIGVMFTRYYLDADGENSLWIGYGDSFTVTSMGDCTSNGFRGQLDIDSCDSHGLKWFNNAHSEISTKISTPVSDTISIVFTFGGRQRSKAYEKNNQNLIGEMVVRRGDINCIECQATIVVPMLSSLQPKII